MASVRVVIAFLACIGWVQAGTDSGSITGFVLNDETGQPIPEALVRVVIQGKATNRAAVSDELGVFVIDGVAAGRISLTASKPGYVRPEWKPSQVARSFVLSSGQHLEHASVGLRRGAAIAGEVTNPSGQPSPGARVILIRCSQVESCDLTTLLQVQATASDLNGRFRFYGLAAGAYLIAADMGASTNETAALLPDSGAIATARSIVELGRAASELSTPITQQQVAVMPTFFPSAEDVRMAEPIKVDADLHSVDGIKIVLRIGSTSAVSGAVTGLDESHRKEARLVVIQSAGLPLQATPRIANFDGSRFTTTNLGPGRYRIVGYVKDELWLDEAFEVGSAGRSSPTGRFLPTITVSGTIAAANDDMGTPLSLAGLTVSFRRVDISSGAAPFDLLRTTTDSRGSFVVTGLASARYLVSCDRPSGWWTASMLVGDKEIENFEVDTASIQSPMTIRLTTTPGQIVGTVRHGDGRPGLEYIVVAFSTRESARFMQSMVYDFVTADGTFALKGLIPGEYYVALLGVADPTEIGEGVLRDLSPSATRVRLLTGETKRLDLQIKGTLAVVPRTQLRSWTPPRRH